VVEERRGGRDGAGIAKDKEDRKMVRKLGTISTIVTIAVLASPLLALAQDSGAAAAMLQHPLRAGLIAISANIGVGIAAFGSALGQGRMAASAMESIGRNPNSAGQIFVPMIIGLAFIEALTLYALVIGILLQGKI
jgi:F-type H+-transporting ATPase subunit c